VTGITVDREESEVEPSVLLENPPLELAERLRRLDPQLVERFAVPTEGLERLGVAVGSVEGEHQLRVQSRPEWLASDERLELPDQLVVTAAGEVCIDAFLNGGDPLLFQSCGFRRRERLFELSERRASPERKSVGEARRCSSRVRWQEHTPLRGKLLEALDVDRAGRHVEHVAGRASDDHIVPERLPELRDVDLDHLARRLGHGSPPEIVDDAIDRDDLTAPQREQREEGTRLPAREPDLRAATTGFDRPQQSNLERITCHIREPRRVVPGGRLL
jgi:hypothetical protein